MQISLKQHAGLSESACCCTSALPNEAESLTAFLESAYCFNGICNLYHADYRIEILHGFHASFPQLKATGKNIYWNPCSLKRKLVPLESESLAVHSGNVMPLLAESACRRSGICSQNTLKLAYKLAQITV